MAPLRHLLLLSLLLPIAIAASAVNPVSVQLNRFRPPARLGPFQRIAGMVSATVLRAQLLKNPRNGPPSTRAALFPHSYGGYSINVSFGTPPQVITLLVDTGSQLTWIPCTGKYLCQNCSSPGNPNADISTFFPRKSSTSKLIGCKNAKCGWIHSPKFLSRCRNCPSNSSDCPQICPPYLLIYGSGSTTGLLISETLRISSRTVANFTLGCSVFSDKQPAGGIAGFGRGVSSLPAQLGLKSFSYCLIPRKYDDAGVSGSLVLNSVPGTGDGAIPFTPLLKNPIPAEIGDGPTEGLSPFSVYYYIGLRKITVGGKNVKIPSKALALGSDGNGGTIIDSGTTFTFMESVIFKPVAAAFVTQMDRQLNRSIDVERNSGLNPCFELPDEASNVSLPALVFHFKGGAEMLLPAENYFAIVEISRPTICLTVVSGGGVGIGGGGPAIILGSFQQQNFDMIYDLKRERLGFQRQSCIAG